MFMDDTASEFVPKGCNNNAQEKVDNVISWSHGLTSAKNLELASLNNHLYLIRLS